MSKPRGPKSGEGIETGLSNLLGALDEAVAEISRRLEMGEDGGVRHSVEVDTRFGQVKAEAGLHIRFVDQRDRSPGAGPASDEAPPTVNPVVYELSQRDGRWHFTADLPGAQRSDLTLSLDEGRLFIETTGRRRYRVDVPFPTELTLTDLAVDLDAGVLTLSARTDGEAEG